MKDLMEVIGLCVFWIIAGLSGIALGTLIERFVYWLWQRLKKKK